MTVWLTDSPDATRAYLPEAATWKSLAPDHSQQLRHLASWFNPDKSAWFADAAIDQVHFPERTVVLIDNARASQFDTVLDVQKKGGELPDGLICLALTGSGFRGQRNRPWSALRGNLHFTAHYRLEEPVSAIQSALTMIPAVASAEAISRMLQGKVDPGIKWVNDVYISGRKVSGVLTATHITGGTIKCVVFGIGINVMHAPGISPTPFVPEAGCLNDVSSGENISLPGLFSQMVTLLDEMVLDLKRGNTGEIFARYLAHADFIDKEVRIWPEGTDDWQTQTPTLRGRIVGLNTDLSLRMEGQDQPIRAGRLAYETTCRKMSLP